MLRVRLVLGANVAGGSSAPEFAATRIYTVPSQPMPPMVQRGLGGQGGNPQNNLLNGLKNGLQGGAKK
jgi:hypothetical protein